MRRVLWLVGVALALGLIVVGAILSHWGSCGPNCGRVATPLETDNGGPTSSTLSIQSAESWDAMNALFTRSEGWVGADGAHSVALGPDRTLWLFCDTWVGSIHEGKRFDATIVNNSVAVQDGRGETSTIRFVVRLGPDGKPLALITPSDARGWFWMQAGAVVDDRLVLFLTQVEKTGDPGVFGFRPVGQWLGIVPNPQDVPTLWRLEQHRLPHTIFSTERELTFGAALMKQGSQLYIYGTDEDVRATDRDRYLIVARVPAAQVGDFTAWEFFHEGCWQADFRKASRIVPGMASDCSVTYLPGRRQYVLVYTERGLSERILARTAPQPWGPWSEPVTAYQCPETGWDRRIFCYNAKAHESLSAGDELVVSYVANSFDFWQVAADARLYWPRFVRVRLEVGD